MYLLRVPHPTSVNDDEGSKILVVAAMSMFFSEMLLPRLERAGVNLLSLSPRTLQLVITCPADFSNVRILKWHGDTCTVVVFRAQSQGGRSERNIICFTWMRNLTADSPEIIFYVFLLSAKVAQSSNYFISRIWVDKKRGRHKIMPLR